MSGRARDPTPRRAGRPRTTTPRDALIRAAVAAFADSGYAAASLDRIADAAGIRKSSLLHRFGSKEALYLESLAAVLGRLGEMVAAAADGRGSFPDRLDRLSGVITDYLFEVPAAARLLFREVMDRGPLFAKADGSVFEAVIATAIAFLQAGVEAGELELSDAADTVMSIAGIHLTYFAAHELSERARGESVFSDAAHARRRSEVIEQVRRLCGVASPG